jgi:hypothetical protein
VIAALDRARLLLPFPMLGIDSDNDSEFINKELIAYCEREKITFTRDRPYKKNDQCFVEQKNGAVVRQLIGYDRFEGEKPHKQLAEVYRAARLYINLFQPSMKLLTKERKGSTIKRKYSSAQTPLQRLLATQILTVEASRRLEEVAKALDPVRLLAQIQTLQDALWKQALLPDKSNPEVSASISTEPTTVSFNVRSCLESNARIISGDGELTLQPLEIVIDPSHRKRAYRRTEKSLGPRTYRTRLDPFAVVSEELKGWLKDEPAQTTKVLFQRLQQRYPGEFPDIQLRTLQRRVQEWRHELIIEFDDQWFTDATLLNHSLPLPLKATVPALN